MKNVIPGGCVLVKAKATDDETIVIILKSPCRHYSSIEMKMIQNADGHADIAVSKVKNRCGIKRCAKNII